jgi:hypothetical protein
MLVRIDWLATSDARFTVARRSGVGMQCSSSGHIDASIRIQLGQTIEVVHLAKSQERSAVTHSMA